MREEGVIKVAMVIGMGVTRKVIEVGAEIILGVVGGHMVTWAAMKIMMEREEKNYDQGRTNGSDESYDRRDGYSRNRTGEKTTNRRSQDRRRSDFQS